MDPADPFRPAAGGANVAGHHVSSNCNGDRDRAHGMNAYHQPNNLGYSMPGMPSQLPQYHASATAPHYASATAPHGMSHYHPSPPNVPQPYQQSPYFTSNNAMINPTNVPGERYSPYTVPGNVAGIPQVRRSENRINLPPIRQNNALAGSVSALGSVANSASGANVNVHGGVAVGAARGGIMHGSSGPLMNTLGTKNSTGNSNENSLPAFLTNQNQSTATEAASAGFVAPTATGGANQSKISHSLPPPETEPPSPLPPLQKSKEPTKLHHHPDMPFLVTHWVDHYAASASIAAGASGTADPSLKRGEGDAAMNAEIDGNEKVKKEALLRLQRAAKDMAWAFETLGAFGVSSNVS